MKNSKLIEILRSFSKQDLKKMDQMVHSSFFTQSENLKYLFSFLHKFAPNFDDPLLNDEDAHKAVYKDLSFKQNRINKLRHNLYNIALQYIYYNYYTEDNLLNNIAILNYAEDKGLTKVLKGHINEIEKKQEQLKIKSGDHFYIEFFLQQVRSRLKYLEDKGNGDILLENVSIALDKFYILNKLILFSHQIIREKITGHDYSYSMKKEILDAMPDSKHVNIPIVSLWYNTFLMVQEKDNFQYYKKLKSLLDEQAGQLPKLDIRNICGCLQNTARTFFRDEALFEELFFLYELQQKHGVFTYANGNYLTATIFFNIAKVGLILQKTSWVKEFLNKHTYKYNSEANNVNALCQAELAFSENDYDQALHFLQQSDVMNVYLKLIRRRSYLKVFYEKGEKYASSFKAAIDRNRTFISRNKESLNSTQLTAHWSFVNTLKTIANYRQSQDRDSKLIHELEEKVHRAEYIAEKKWLLQKIKFLK